MKRLPRKVGMDNEELQRVDDIAHKLGIKRMPAVRLSTAILDHLLKDANIESTLKVLVKSARSFSIEKERTEYIAESFALTIKIAGAVERSIEILVENGLVSADVVRQALEQDPLEDPQTDDYKDT